MLKIEQGILIRTYLRKFHPTSGQGGKCFWRLEPVHHVMLSLSDPTGECSIHAPTKHTECFAVIKCTLRVEQHFVWNHCCPTTAGSWRRFINVITNKSFIGFTARDTLTEMCLHWPNNLCALCLLFTLFQSLDELFHQHVPLSFSKRLADLNTQHCTCTRSGRKQTKSAVALRQSHGRNERKSGTVMGKFGIPGQGLKIV